MRVQRCHSRPARPAHRALLETCALHRASLHCAASPCGSPNLLSLPAASGQREGSQSACAVLLVACHCLPISRVLAVDRSTLPWLCCKPRLVEASPRPPLSYDTGMAASGEKAPRYRTFGHWPLEPVTQASAGRSLLVVPRAALMSPESVPQGSRCTACASNPRSDASYRAHLPSRVPIPAMPDSCAGQTPKPPFL